MKKILEDIFGLDQDGNLSITELTAGGAWMQMLSDRPVQTEEAVLWDEDCDLENYDPDEVAFLMENLSDLPEIDTEAETDLFSDDILQAEQTEPNVLEQMRCALRQAGFDRADVEMLYEEEIQEALEEAGLSWEDALEMDRDELREQLLYVISAGLSREVQLKIDLLDCGFDLQELANMRQEEREEALEDAGLEWFDYEQFDFQGCL